MHRPGHKETKKDPIWYMGEHISYSHLMNGCPYTELYTLLAPNDMPQNIVTTTDIHVRARMRRLLAPAFNEEALRNQEPVLQMYADKVVDRLRLLVQQEAPQKGAVINFLDWLNFYAIDIMGDLGSSTPACPKPTSN